MRSIQIPIFKIWYSSAFIILFLITLVLTLVSPADLIYQSVKVHSIPNVITIAAAYLATALFCLFIWASRIYTNRAVLRDIPKRHVPVDHGDVPRKVRRLIERMWHRSALVAWDSRPKDVTVELREADDAQLLPRKEHLFHHRRHAAKETTVVPVRRAFTAWGSVAHAGWSAPDAAGGQAQSVRFWSVLVELPHLLEAKAVSLAPEDPAFLLGGSSLEAVDAPPAHRIVALLQRPQGMGFRDYIGHLESLGMLEEATEIELFVEQYEHARFSTKPLTEAQFEGLMSRFSALLSAISFDIDRVTPFLEESDSDSAETGSNYQMVDAPSLESDMDGSVRRHHARSSTSPSVESFGSVIINSQAH